MRQPAWTLILLSLALASAAAAQPDGDAPAPISQPGAAKVNPPGVIHSPRHHAPAGEPLEIRAAIPQDWTLSQPRVAWRSGDGPWSHTPFVRTGDQFAATIPGDAVRAGTLAYHIESGPEGEPRAHFGRREDPHLIAVTGDAPVDREAARLARYRGQRNHVRVSSELLRFGANGLTTDAGPDAGPDAEPQRTDAGSDRFWRIEAEYTHRLLGDTLHDFRFGIGAMRGEWPTVGGEAVTERANPGLTYGFGEVNVELTDWILVGGRLVLGVGSERFVGGLGAVARVGNPGGTHFAATVDRIQDVGTRADLRLHWDTVPRVPMALGLELSDWPSGLDSTQAANLSYDIGYRFDGGLTLSARIGSAKRNESFSGGLQGGLSAGWGF